ncbi:MAG TPA: TOMM precursor leader peptide-binding protein [Bryobacteraceae bacterium]|nr:TOMM precursor leader peptide-binding protein [Bryobacteraceae bacterium]
MSFEDRETIRIAPRWAALCRSGDRLLLSTEETALCLDEPATADVAEALIETRTVSQLERSLASRRSPAQIGQALDDLDARGLLQTGPDPPTAQSAYWDSVGCPAPSATVAFLPLCQAGRGAIETALKSNGLRLATNSEFLIVTTDDYLCAELVPLASREHPWLLAKPVGHTVWLGPLFIPGTTPCWSCMALWMKPHRWQQIAFYGCHEENLPPQPSFAAIPASIGIAANLIAAAAALWIARGRHSELEGAILSLDTRSLRFHRSVLRKHPDCKRCNLASPVPKPAALHSFVSPLTGILSAIQVTDEPVCGFFHALGHFAAPLPEPAVSRMLRTQHSVGKGLTSYEAEACCIAEALERYSVLFRGDEPRVRARIGQLEAAIPPEDVLLFSEAQYRDREHWNDTHSEIQWVPERLDPSVEIDWTQVRSLASGRPRFVPTALCFMHYDFRSDAQFCAADSNGCAAGPTFTDATLTALLELIERDAVAIWWYNRLNLPAIDLAALGDARILQAEKALRDSERCLYVLDISSDLGLPACVAIAPKLDGSEPCFGAAAELTHQRAAFKAIAEASQVCFWARTGNGSEELLSWLRHTCIQDHSYLRAHGTKIAPAPVAMPPSAALEHTVKRLQIAGLEAFSLDLTRTETGVPVARVFVPGLRHFWARLAPGRLYQTPVRLGLLDSRYEEAELNPVPCMI